MHLLSMRTLPFMAVAMLLALPASARPRMTVPAGYTETTLTTSLQRPVALAWIPGGRLLIAEQYTGAIRVFKNSALLATPFATISPINTNNNETGFVGLCADPNFAANGYVYAFATQTATVQRIWRITTNGVNFTGDTGTVGATPLIDNIPSNNVNHNGGGIGFGPDGKLYVSVGENGSATQAEAQNTTTWRGKILRFNADGSIPTDNPFGATNAIHCHGLRNSFRFAWRPSGSLIATENGPNVDDEINKIVAGANYGWPNDTGPNTNPAYTNPLFTFGTTISITGIVFYGGSTLPFSGEMLYVDYKNGRIRRMTLDGADAVTSGPTDFVTGANQPVDLAIGPDGALYYSTLVGGLYKVQANGTGNLAPTASFTATPTGGAPPLLVNVNASASYDSDGSIASYSWDWGDASPLGSGIAASHTYAAQGSYTLQLTVTDNQGAIGTSSQGIIVTTGNPPPSAHIESATPSTGAAPLLVQFSGHGHDDANGLTHAWNFGDGSAVVTFTNVVADSNTNPSHTFAADGAYLVTLTVTDAGALTSLHSVPITVGSGAGGGGGGGKEKRCGLLGLEAMGLLLLRRRRR